MFSFLEIHIVDIIDILLCAYVLYFIYRFIRGTMAANIVMSILAFLLLWVIVRTLNMSMMTAIMNSFINIGLIALIVIFQPEIRSSLIRLSSEHSFFQRLGIDKLLYSNIDEDVAPKSLIDNLVGACNNMSKSKTGALIVIRRKASLTDIIKSGDEINSQLSQQLIETIFFKNTPLHDGALVVDKNGIIAASCILPVSNNKNVPKSFGLRHRAALGISEVSDAIIIVVSEESGNISIFEHGEYIQLFSAYDLNNYLSKI